MHEKPKIFSLFKFMSTEKFMQIFFFFKKKINSLLSFFLFSFSRQFALAILFAVVRGVYERAVLCRKFLFFSLICVCLNLVKIMMSSCACSSYFRVLRMLHTLIVSHAYVPAATYWAVCVPVHMCDWLAYIHIHSTRPNEQYEIRARKISTASWFQWVCNANHLLSIWSKNAWFWSFRRFLLLLMLSGIAVQIWTKQKSNRMKTKRNGTAAQQRKNEPKCLNSIVMWYTHLNKSTYIRRRSAFHS